MRISASQMGTFQNCRRFWFFEKIQKLSSGGPQAHFTFGTVLHATCERWLEGEEDLYPDGWMDSEERDGSISTVTPAEAKSIQRLVQEAIDEGVLRRMDGTQVERELLIPVVEGVDLIGFIDVYRERGEDGLPILEDHKTFSKGSLRYIMNEKPDSPSYLGKNQQLKTYAWASSQLDGYEGDVRLRHNQFPKFPKRAVSVAEAVLPKLEIDNHGEWLKATARDMQRTGKIKDWADVPGPEDSSKCSRWYGKPCPFSQICGRLETVDGYRVRSEQIATAIREGTVAPSLTVTKSSVMGLFDNVQRPGADINGAAPAPAPAPKAPAADAEPWANPDCTACDGSGLASSGRPCQMCEAVSKRNGGQSASDVALDGAADPGPADYAELIEEVAAIEATPEPEPAPAPAAPEARGLRLFIGAIPRGVDAVDSSQLLARLGADLASDMGADSYWGLDTFKRRERLAERAPEIVASLAGQDIVHLGVLGNDDIGSLLRALMSQTEGIDLVVVAVA